MHQRNKIKLTCCVTTYSNGNIGMMLPNTVSVRIFNNLQDEVQNAEAKYAIIICISMFLKEELRTP